ARAGSSALGWFREDERVTLILARNRAAAFGFTGGTAMRRIALQVYWALEGTGLTAAVASALAAEGIPCNMVAAYHHDHVFVPAALAERAVVVLRDLQARAAAL